jgi:hypothetical protein
MQKHDVQLDLTSSILSSDGVRCVHIDYYDNIIKSIKHYTKLLSVTEAVKQVFKSADSGKQPFYNIKDGVIEDV